MKQDYIYVCSKLSKQIKCYPFKQQFSKYALRIFTIEQKLPHHFGTFNQLDP